MHVILNLLKWYIYLYYTGPPNFASYVKFTSKYSIESKKEGGKIILSLQIVSTMLLLSCSICCEHNLFEQTFLKKWLISVSVFHILFDNKSLFLIGISVCINTWQSWLFIPYNLHSSKFINLIMFEAYSSGNHRLLSH
jgi:hypothetical protein